jgi:3-(3-hydroxy-phenyl)propionate hydroxylase
MTDARGNAILIAGAGPVGLTAGLALLRRGVAVTVLEAKPALDTAPRDSTFHPPTLGMLVELGMGARLIADGLRVDRFQYRDRSAGVVAEFDLGRLRSDTPYPFRLQCPPHRLAELVLGEIEASPWADVGFGDGVVGVTQDADGVTARVETGSGPREIRGPCLLGVDGASSTVRRQLDGEFEGLTYPVRSLVLGTTFDFAAHFPDLADVTYAFDP